MVLEQAGDKEYKDIKHFVTIKTKGKKVKVLKLDGEGKPILAVYPYYREEEVALDSLKEYTDQVKADIEASVSMGLEDVIKKHVDKAVKEAVK